MQWSYKPRDASKPPVQVEAGRSFSTELAEVRSAIAALNASYALVGQTPPEPPTFRGRIGARLVKLVQRLLFWYTPQIVHFQYSALRAMEELANEIQQDRGCGTGKRATDKVSEKTASRNWRRAFSNSSARRPGRTCWPRSRGDVAEALERRLEALRLQALPRIDRELARLRAQQTVQEKRMALRIEGRSELSAPSSAAACREPAARNSSCIA
jgi:hypothetical protein